MAHFNDLNLDFIDIEQEGQVQQIIDEQPPSRLLYAEHGSSTQGRKRTDVIIGTNEGTCKIYGKKGDDMLISSSGGVTNAKGNSGADTFVLNTGGRMCIRDFRPEEGDILLLPSDDYCFDRKKGHLVLYCDDVVVAKFNGGSDDFIDINIESF